MNVKGREIKKARANSAKFELFSFEGVIYKRKRCEYFFNFVKLKFQRNFLHVKTQFTPFLCSFFTPGSTRKQ